MFSARVLSSSSPLLLLSLTSLPPSLSPFIMGVTKAEGGGSRTDMMKWLRLNGVTEGGELKKEEGFFYDRALFAALFKGGGEE